MSYNLRVGWLIKDTLKDNETSSPVVCFSSIHSLLAHAI